MCDAVQVESAASSSTEIAQHEVEDDSAAQRGAAADAHWLWRQIGLSKAA